MKQVAKLEMETNDSRSSRSEKRLEPAASVLRVVPGAADEPAGELAASAAVCSAALASVAGLVFVAASVPVVAAVPAAAFQRAVAAARVLTVVDSSDAFGVEAGLVSPAAG